MSHFLEKLSFGVTEKFGGRDDIMQRMEKFGGIFDCQTHRDTALYAASVDSREVIYVFKSALLWSQLC